MDAIDRWETISTLSFRIKEVESCLQKLFTLPTRGNIHDLSGAITHKREIIILYLQGYLTPDIALKTNHSKEAVDRISKIIIESRFSGSTILKIPTKFLICPDYLNVLSFSTLIFYQLYCPKGIPLGKNSLSKNDA